LATMPTPSCSRCSGSAAPTVMGAFPARTSGCGGADYRKAGSLGALIEGAELHLAVEVLLLACVIADGARRRAIGLGCHHLAKGIIGHVQISGELDVRDVQGLADFVEAVGLAVFGKGISDLEPGSIQEI